MHETITLPTLSDTMQTGRLVQWLKQVGDPVKKGEVLAEVEDDYQGATFYLSNLGVFAQVTHFDALVPPGAAAILSLGAEQDGKAEFTLSCDHRVVFGADAARFLETLSAYLSNPESMATATTDSVQSLSKGKRS